MMRARRLLPGFSLTMGMTLAYLGLIVLLPLGAMLVKAAGMSLEGFIAATTGPRALAAYQVTLVSAAEAVIFNGLAGLLFAWVLARYQFAGRNLLDALIDLPFAMPTAVAGLALAAAFAPNGWVGQHLEPLGFKVVHAQPGIAIAMAFTSLPFVVRSVQPVIEELETETEEAARTLGASEMQIFLKVILPTLAPSLLAGMSPGLRPLPGRVRRHHLHRRQPPVRDRDRRPADLHQAGGIRIRLGHRHRHRGAGLRLRHHAADQRHPGLAAALPGKGVRR
ncbi:sulfate ABC transporter permease subunit CysT [Paramagnetospirillum magneticum]|uniref:Sulfate transport system permease protein CysT n=1 Tax=Paramagnetospirillum magneticum (strain ATCC 700264 / AMB-1) TaxID=342108 RepID=Q2W1A5_PARM1|nr:ABC-type sulfate transport system, permease component [Paramagnetospirillum magneticum AMB-1]